MFKKTAFALTLLSLTLTASASNWQVGGGFGTLSENADDEDVSLNIIYGSVAYKIQKDDSNFFFVPELRLGKGIGDDSISDVTVDVERFIALSVRGQYEYGNGAYAYVVPSYANLKGKVTYKGKSASDDNWEFGFGAGIGYRLNEKVSVEASFEKYDDIDLLSASFKYTF